MFVGLLVVLVLLECSWLLLVILTSSATLLLDRRYNDPPKQSMLSALTESEHVLVCSSRILTPWDSHALGIYQENHENPPTFGSGVLEHVNGGRFPPPTPLHSGRFVGHPPKIDPFEPNGPSLDPFGLNRS